MAKLSKRQKAFSEKLEHGKLYPIEEALELLKSVPQTKFDQSVDVSVNLGVDPRKSDQVVRGSTVLPNGTGKTVRVAVFAQGPNADAAKEAGADVVGFEDLAEDIKKSGLYLSGGNSLVPGLPRLVEHITGLSCTTSKKGQLSCITGAEIILGNIQKYKDLTISSHSRQFNN